MHDYKTGEIQTTYFVAYTTANKHNISEVKEELWAKWQTFIDEERARAPAGMKSVFQASEDWAQMTTFNALKTANVNVILITIFVGILL